MRKEEAELKADIVKTNGNEWAICPTEQSNCQMPSERLGRLVWGRRGDL